MVTFEPMKYEIRCYDCNGYVIFEDGDVETVSENGQEVSRFVKCPKCGRKLITSYVHNNSLSLIPELTKFYTEVNHV